MTDRQRKTWMERTGRIYSNLRERERAAAEKRAKDLGVVNFERLAIKLPFTLAEFREWLDMQRNDGMRTRPWACFYCDERLTVKRISIDHFHPLAFGGRTKLGNLGVCCLRCNQRKGNLGYMEYVELRSMVRDWDHRMRADLWNRLRQRPTRHWKKENS